MAKITEYREIPLDDLTIGTAQVRTQEPGREIEDLAESIKVQGLLQPIIVCRAQKTGKWEILAGQRRFLAHRILKKKSIPAAVLDERVEEGEAKAISITENLMRRKLSGKDLTDGILHLYKYYGTIRAVVETTGLPHHVVRDNVKYPRLIPELKERVDNQEIDINAALKAQDAATDDDGEPDVKVAVELAQTLNPMSDVQRRKFSQESKKHPESSISDRVEQAITGAQVTQIVITITQETHEAIQKYAKEEKINQDAAGASLIEEALIGHGLLEGDN